MTLDWFALAGGSFAGFCGTLGFVSGRAFAGFCGFLRVFDRFCGRTAHDFQSALRFYNFYFRARGMRFCFFGFFGFFSLRRSFGRFGFFDNKRSRRGFCRCGNRTRGDKFF